MRRLLVLTAGTVLAVSAAPAAAAEAERTGWWNRVSAGSVVAPAPTAAEGDLRVAGTGDTPAAYAAVLYRAPGASVATLDLTVRPGTATGTPDVVACPTTTQEWPAGGNQPFEQAPPFDCDRGQAVGSLSEDGTTLSFVLDPSTSTAPGTWSLALVPVPDGASPFALDLQAPGPEAFRAEAAETDDPAADSGQPDVEDGTGSDEAGSGDTGGTAPAPLLPGAESFAPPGADAGTAASPLIADVAPPDAAPVSAGAGPAPALAAGEQAAAPRTFRPRPVAQAVPGGEGGRLLALLLLVGLSGAVGYAAGQSRPGPRLIGGRASSAAAPAAAPAEPPARERGIGRFAKQRTAAPRRLR